MGGILSSQRREKWYCQIIRYVLLDRLLHDLLEDDTLVWAVLYSLHAIVKAVNPYQ